MIPSYQVLFVFLNEKGLGNTVTIPWDCNLFKAESMITGINLCVDIKVVGGVDGTRTRDPRRDRPVF